MKEKMLDVVVVGAGHAGLAAGYYLKKYGLTHLIFERGKIGESWRSQRWDSFVLNTANKLNGLPGAPYSGDSPEGFSSATAFVSSLEEYVATFQLPVVEKATILSIEKPEESPFFLVIVSIDNSLRQYACRQVIIASGAASETRLPLLAKRISPAIKQLHAGEYRRPEQLPDGAILVVGSAQSGCQIAEDLADAGRKVYLSTSQVARIPRRYRGQDTLDWLMQTKFFDVRTEEITDPALLHMKAPQLTGTGAGNRTISLQALSRKGVKILGKLESAAGKEIFLQPNAPLHVQFADGFSAKVKAMIDGWIAKNQLPVPIAEPDEADVPDGNANCADVTKSLNVEEHSIRSIIWATGFTGNFGYIKLPVLNRDGNPKHQNGITAVQGLYFLGLPWLRSRKSGLICGVAEDAEFIAGEVFRFVRPEFAPPAFYTE